MFQNDTHSQPVGETVFRRKRSQHPTSSCAVPDHSWQPQGRRQGSFPSSLIGRGPVARKPFRANVGPNILWKTSKRKNMARIPNWMWAVFPIRLMTNAIKSQCWILNTLKKEMLQTFAHTCRNTEAQIYFSRNLCQQKGQRLISG